MGRMKIVGLAGKARAGKTTVAMRLVDQHGYGDYAFAEPIKRGLREMFGLSDEQLYMAEKDSVVPWLGVTPRYLAQTLGTEWGRDTVANDLWIRCAERWLQAVPRYWPGIVFSDVRFEDEAAFVRRHGGLMVHVRREAAQAVEGHKSEFGIDVLDGDLVLHNDGDLAALYSLVDDLLMPGYTGYA